VPNKKVSNFTATSTLANSDIFPVVTDNGDGTYSNKKITFSDFSASIGALDYKGTWDASTNTPTLMSSSGAKGDYYKVSVAGNTNLDGITDWQVGDWAIFNGTVWEKIDNSDSVSSVFGRSGAVVAQSGDYEATQITNFDSQARTAVEKSNLSTGFSIAGGTTSKTLTISENCTLDQNLSKTSFVQFSSQLIESVGSNAYWSLNAKNGSTLNTSITHSANYLTNEYILKDNLNNLEFATYSSGVGGSSLYFNVDLVDVSGGLDVVGDLTANTFALKGGTGTLLLDGSWMRWTMPNSGNGSYFEIYKQSTDAREAFRVTSNNSGTRANKFVVYCDGRIFTTGLAQIGTGIQIGSVNFVDSSRNISNAGTISSGAITSSGNVRGTSFNISGTQIVDSSRNLTNIGTVTSGAITSTGTLTSSSVDTGFVLANSGNFTDLVATNDFQVDGTAACTSLAIMTTGITRTEVVDINRNILNITSLSLTSNNLQLGVSESLSNGGVVTSESYIKSPVGRCITLYRANVTSPSGTLLRLRSDFSSTNFRAFDVNANGDVLSATGSYGTISDERLKENFVPAKSQWEDVKAFKLWNFNYKNDPYQKKMLGFKAQESQAISPGVVGEMEAEIIDGQEYRYLYEKLTIKFLKLFGAFQEAQARIEHIESILGIP